METYEILEQGLAVIEREENWTQIIAVEKEAGIVKCACTHGALQVVQPDWEGNIDDPAWCALSRACPVGKPIIFNDAPGRKHSEVVEMWQRAIQAEKAKAGIHIEVEEAEHVPVG